MILDLDGVTSEPTRRRHVVALSAATAAIALVLLSALFAPAPRIGPTLLAASAAPSPGSATVAHVLASTTWIQGGPFEESMRDAVSSTVCAAAIGSSPPVHLVLDADGRAVAAYTSGATGRFIPLPRVYVGPGWVAVPCDTSDVFAPRLNRAR
jgi:hypothetical protein